MSVTYSRLAVKITPNARRSEVSGLSGAVWRIKVAAPPDKGKANKELIEFLSKILGVKKQDIEILQGHTSHNKMVAVSGLSQEEIKKKLGV